ncbi:MAG: LysR family transcriptional regulator substrate-binding protein [Cypionkella sp.]|nr:LysR family transcriptional regulator substrate-binding protein [Cypionkella sp.]MDO8983758.1 LysR family transcriptional regulator substrate-binding protein [Cypionkella sp.]
MAVLPDLPIDARFCRAAAVRQEVVAIVGAQSPLVGLASVTLARLAQEPLIYRTQGSSTQKIIDRALRQAGLAPQPRLVADTRNAVYEAVAVGIGVGFMWRYGTNRTDAVRVSQFLICVPRPKRWYLRWQMKRTVFWICSLMRPEDSSRMNKFLDLAISRTAKGMRV